MLDELARSGKIRHIGLSNETPWGVHRFLHLAETRGWPRIVSIQNPYNLLNRSFEIGLAEMAIREQVGLLAYSPLAFGLLSGKYENGAQPPKARLTLYARFQRYNNPQARRAASAYVALAREHGLDPAQMALAYVSSRPFLTSNIIGATTLEQLDSNLASLELTLSDTVLLAIEQLHAEQPNRRPEAIGRSWPAAALRFPPHCRPGASSGPRTKSTQGKGFNLALIPLPQTRGQGQDAR